MNAQVDDLHTRLLKCDLVLDASRAYWQHRDATAQPPAAAQVFEGGWFGAKSLARIKVLLTNLRARFDAFPEALAVLHRWQGMPPDVRAHICHWHLQLVDPLYRRFTAEYLPLRRRLDATVSREQVVRFVGEQGHARWTMPTRIQFASKLTSCAHHAGLIGKGRTTRPVTLPRVDPLALGYLLYLLRGVSHPGAPLGNPYLASVGLTGGALHDRLRRVPGLTFRAQAGVVDLGWDHPDLATWAQAHLPLRGAA